jgi:phage terminase large subunit-like protein
VINKHCCNWTRRRLSESAKAQADRRIILRGGLSTAAPSRAVGLGRRVLCRPCHVTGALWKKEIFGANREPAPETEAEREALLATLLRVVIGVDPSGCAGEQDTRSDEIGIVAVGLGHDGIARVLEDATDRYSPDEWANKALVLCDRWKADKIVAEKNFGGAMVESTIRTARRHAPVKLVNASRGKVQRAEPVSLLYDRGKIRHVGQFVELERQFCPFSPAGYGGA